MSPRKRSAARDGAAHTAYLVLGVHRSGTSALTQLLALAGADLPANLMPGDRHNEKGYFEPWKIALLNDERLWAAGSSWDDAFAFPYRPLPPAEERAWIQRAAALFVDEYGRAAWPLLKDPRVSVLLPAWKSVLAELGIGARAVIQTRHPLAVAGSLKRRDGYPTERSLLLWCAYMLASEAYTRDMPRAFVEYESLLADWRGQVARIEAAHGAPLPALTEAAAREIDGFLTPDLRHNSGGGLEGLGWTGDLTARVMGWFDQAAAGPEPDRGVLEEAAAELARRREEVGLLVSPMGRDLDIARTELREARRVMDAERAAAQSAYRRDREGLERGWQADVRRLEALVEAREGEASLLAAHAREALEELESLLADPDA